ncbi:phosphoglycolate phosphatase [Candidatus Methylospira mobilis]|uniref:Phosphoglycolate phosphatase n=1 Tax=Candidatus Methylospira mobilis TaxID=1808979 RepID=A0A5Q0BHL5_9GAMM|nr:phosphoglycolate phosphatase [Candidatus Methylospira mobilis]QFY41618.1 phosphoglycolate phosphatase [Candidatus Methylospira mobilis]WNV05133.1 phosphoglycolate phosphatase [Candidatus Methylospira mobilis]
MNLLKRAPDGRLSYHPKLIAFDLDGTLVDTAPDLVWAIERMLEETGRAPAGFDRARGWIGNGVPMLVKRALTGQMQPENTPEDYDSALARFKSLYTEHVFHLSRLYPGALKGLQQIRADGYITACLTNKHADFTMPLLERAGIARYFDFIGCGNQYEKQKPHPEPLLKTAERFSVTPAECLMVGDSENDVKAARAAGYAIACVPYGYRSCEKPEELSADFLVASLTDLARLLHEDSQ